MNSFTEPNTITCETTEEHSHPYTTVISSLGQSVPISGVSGAVYAPMDTTPKPQQRDDTLVARLLATLTDTLTLLVKELQTPTQPQIDLEEAVTNTLETAEWFDGRVSEYLDEKVESVFDNHDFDYAIGDSVERYMRNSFDPNDHVDFRDLVADRVDDLIDELVAEKVEERLTDLLEEKLKDANITINF